MMSFTMPRFRTTSRSASPLMSVEEWQRPTTASTLGAAAAPATVHGQTAAQRWVVLLHRPVARVGMAAALLTAAMPRAAPVRLARGLVGPAAQPGRRAAMRLAAMAMAATAQAALGVLAGPAEDVGLAWASDSALVWQQAARPARTVATRVAPAAARMATAVIPTVARPRTMAPMASPLAVSTSVFGRSISSMTAATPATTAPTAIPTAETPGEAAMVALPEAAALRRMPVTVVTAAMPAASVLAQVRAAASVRALAATAATAVMEPAAPARVAARSAVRLLLSA